MKKESIKNDQKSFSSAVYNTVKKIPKGKVSTYGTVAGLSGNPHASRAVGWALHHNPDQTSIPCHRVVNREGRLAPSFVFGGSNAQKILLENEGVIVHPDSTVDLHKFGWKG